MTATGLDRNDVCHDSLEARMRKTARNSLGTTPGNRSVNSLHSSGYPAPAAKHVYASQRLGPTQHDSFLTPYYSLLENAKITFLEFVKSRFVPEHVLSKSAAGKRHYHAMLKHILNPTTVSELFIEDYRSGNGRLKPELGWPYLDNVRLCEVSVDHVKAIISAALKNGYSIQTVQHIRNVIGAILTHATNTHHFTGKNPAYQVPLPTAVRQPALRLNSIYLKQILERMQNPERQIAVIAMFTGLTLEDICALQWKQVNVTELPSRMKKHFLPPGTIAVHKPASVGRSQRMQLTRIRDVRISDVPLALLRRLNSRRPGSNPEDLVFESGDGSALSTEDLSDKLMKLGTELRMPWLSWRLLTKAHKHLAKGPREIERNLPFVDLLDKGDSTLPQSCRF
jgi:integrase